MYKILVLFLVAMLTTSTTARHTVERREAVEESDRDLESKVEYAIGMYTAMRDQLEDHENVDISAPLGEVF